VTERRSLLGTVHQPALPINTQERIRVDGSPLDYLGYDQVLERIDDTLSRSKQRLTIVSVNLDHLTYFGSRTAGQRTFDESQPDAEWLFLADGWPISVWAARVIKGPWPLLPGSDLLPLVLELLEERGMRLGILGGEPATHEAFARVLGHSYPNVEIAGFWSPARSTLFEAVPNRLLTEAIRAARVDVLVVSLGKPRQELWLARYGQETGARVSLALGAAPEFIAGTRRRAPEIWRRMRMEWLYRLFREPRRLGRRYLVEAPRAVLRLLWALVSPARRL
jgi:N-acetylglucosaminyldiphosphoundecaprenol N-acetyl-beta-D-mannosaminyltransferase